MADPERANRIVIELSANELGLIRAALRLLLGAEDDTETINELKVLLARLPAEGPG